MDRIVRRTKEGYELEGGPRHAELVVEQIELGDLAQLSSPGVDCVETEKNDPGDIELDPATASNYWRIFARCSYLAADRPELQFAVNETFCEMSKPTHSS